MTVKGERFTSPQFRNAVQGLVKIHGIRKVAEILHNKWVPFEDAYMAIFGRKPRILFADFVSKWKSASGQNIDIAA
jgi:hypothetical protein